MNHQPDHNDGLDTCRVCGGPIGEYGSEESALCGDHLDNIDHDNQG